MQGTNAHDTYAWDEQSKTWRHLANALLHYAESGKGLIVQPHTTPAGGATTYLVYLPLRCVLLPSCCVLPAFEPVLGSC